MVVGMKDYKAECDVLRGRIKELEEALRYERLSREQREHADRAIRDKFKELLLDVLGR
jgi:hypothetical protein